MSIEAMKQALEALERYCTPYADGTHPADEAIAALRQAIEQAEKNEHPMRALLKQAFGQPSEIPKIGCVNHDCDKCKAAAQREWVGLTDEEIDGLVANTRWHELIKATEAKLKEKNT